MKKSADDAAKLANRMRNLERRQSEAHRIASAAARYDRNDPFVYDRVFSRIMNGVGDEYKYGDGS